MSSVVTPTIPPLLDGERLSREEFHRRYLAMPHVKKAELIDGVVQMPSPVRTDVEGAPRLDLIGWIGNYCWRTPGLRGGCHGTIRFRGDNELQPDIMLMIDRTIGGQAMLDADGYITGGPELLAEVSPSSASKKRNKRKRVFQVNGVYEYILWRTEDGEIDWFVLRNGEYEALPLKEGVFESEVFPGLWLDPAALLRGDGVAVLATLQRGIASAEHAAFVERLRQP